MSMPLLVAVVGFGTSVLLFRLAMIWPGRRHPRPSGPVFAMAELGLITLGLQLVFMLVAPYLVSALDQLRDPSGDSSVAHGMLVTVSGNLGIVLAVLATGRTRYGLGPEKMGLKPPSPWSLPLATLLLCAAAPAFVGASLLNAEIIEALGWESNQALVKALLLDEGLRGNPLLLTCIVVLVPLLEEVLFRGFLQSALRVALGPVPSIVAASLLFAIVHDIQSALPVFIVGLTLGVIFERTGSIWASGWAHALFNGLQVANIFFLSS